MYAHRSPLPRRPSGDEHLADHDATVLDALLWAGEHRTAAQLLSYWDPGTGPSEAALTARLRRLERVGHVRAHARGSIALWSITDLGRRARVAHARRTSGGRIALPDPTERPPADRPFVLLDVSPDADQRVAFMPRGAAERVARARG
ncbi:hypothetical protein [Patulibacter sp. SYSU D01012]|uniref:hypothetical protein n=1 Tax=Patulibacter sp. SYSU D01012 TaxID=2817381 RepID=UPI001B300D09|nr:hypothetical protein [Patulibacter sp. SYSU D01012]